MTQLVAAVQLTNPPDTFVGPDVATTTKAGVIEVLLEIFTSAVINTVTALVGKAYTVVWANAVVMPIGNNSVGIFPPFGLHYFSINHIF